MKRTNNKLLADSHKDIKWNNASIVKTMTTSKPKIYNQIDFNRTC